MIFNKMVRSFCESIYPSKSNIYEAEMDQGNLLESMVKFVKRNSFIRIY